MDNKDWASVAYHSIIESGDDWADKDSAHKFLEDSKKTVLAQIANTIDEKSQTAKESKALAHPEFVQFLENLRDARRAANKAKVQYEGQKTLSSLRQTQESLKKAEMNLR